MLNNLPLNWCECKLGDVFHTSSGGTPSRRETAYYGGNIPWLKSGELNDGIISEAEEFITKEGLENSSAKIFPKGSILLALYGATVGKIGILDFDSATNQAVCCIYSNPYFDKNLLFYYLLSQRKHLINQGKGGAQPNISQDIVKNLVLPLPPLAEQERIVEKIEALFAGIDEGVERLKSAQAQIKQYRQSVLKSAFEGKLYKTTDWKEVKLENIISNEKYAMKRGPFGSSLKKEFFVPVGIRVFEQYNPINNDPYWARYFITKEKYKELYAFRAGPRDLLISCSGTLGKILELPADVEEGIINQALLKISLNNKKISNQFFIYWFNSNQTQKLILENVRGAAIQNIASVKELKQISILLPTISEQQHIVAEIEKRFAVADELEKAVNEGLEKADELKQFILKKAFEGKLAPQNPNDEPASVLLDRIKASKQPQSKGKKK